MPDDAVVAAGAPSPESPRPLVGLSIAGPVCWTRVWSRMSPDDRHRACEAYLEDAGEHAGALDAAVALVASASRSRPQAVRRMGRSRIAARLARARGLPDACLHSLVVSFHCRRRLPMLARFLDTAGIPHAEGHVVLPNEGEPAPLHRLVAAVEAIVAEFPAEHVALYLDALELEGRGAWSSLSTARVAAAQRVPSGGKAPLSA